MKPNDALLDAMGRNRWPEKATPAILDPAGEVVRAHFDEIEDTRPRFAKPRFGSFRPGNVLAVQIGNHEDWPSILLACLRTRSRASFRSSNRSAINSAMPR